MRALSVLFSFVLIANSLHRRYMHLKNHDIGLDQHDHTSTLNLSSGSDFQGHLCEDGRVYLMNLSRAAPADLPDPGTNQILTHQLRPEFIQHYHKPLTGDAYRPEMEKFDDFLQNAEETCEASLELRNVTIPALVSSLDGLTKIPLDSRSITELLHVNGVNVRRPSERSERGRSNTRSPPRGPSKTP